jgi:hypothetical protein
MQIIYSENECKISSPMGELESNTLLIKVIAKFLVDNSQILSDITISPSPLNNSTNMKRIMTLLWDKEDDFVEYAMRNIIPPKKDS